MNHNLISLKLLLILVVFAFACTQRKSKNFPGYPDRSSELDVSGKIRAGENQIEILVYNTLGNHFLTTPSRYIGRTDSGLMGPVKLIITKQN